MSARIKSEALADKAVRAPVRRWFMVPMRDSEIVEALHEPYSQVIGNEQNNRDRFMASIHVRILEVSPSHEPYPLIPSFSPSGGEGARRAVEGDSDRFMASTRVRILEVFTSPEPRSSRREEARFSKSEI